MSRTPSFPRALLLASLVGLLAGVGVAGASALATAPDDEVTAGYKCQSPTACESGNNNCDVTCKEAKKCYCITS